MQLSLTTAMTQPSALSPFKQRQERQPNQPLEASVADSFTPSTAQAQSRSGANRWGFLAPIMAGSLLFLPSCGIKVEEKAATVLEKATEQVVKSAPAAEEKALEKTAKAAEDSAIDLIQNIEASEAYKNVNAIAVSIVKEGGNEATTSESFDRSKLDAEKKMKVIGLPTLKALSCPKKNGQYPLSFTTGEPLNTFSTLEKCLVQGG